MKISTVRAALYGAAFGDAIGRPVEFKQMPQIRDLDRHGALIKHATGRVTDDTEMMIATGDAIMRAPAGADPEALTGEFIRAYLDWRTWDKAGRAPGNTCMGALARLQGIHEDGAPWYLAADMGSKGCGANMRVQPIAFLPGDEEYRAGVAQMSAAMTHGHPTALAAADLTQHAVYLAAWGYELGDLIEHLLMYARMHRTTYHAEWLGSIWTRSNATSAEDYISAGWDEMSDALERVLRAPARIGWNQDPCHFTGAGWAADEALATALYCVQLGAPRSQQVIHRAARTSGDSDSIACIAGSIIGAFNGEKHWPSIWYETVEYSARLQDLSWFIAD